MSNVKWIRLTLSMFDDEKIRLIEQMPEADTILMIWIKLLVQAGKVNASGSIYLNENIPYTDEMLATIFDRPISTVRLALETFKQFGMLSIDENDIIHITNWEKHQNVDGLERIREQTRKRVARHRKKKRLEQQKPRNDKVNDGVTLPVTLRNAPEEEQEEEREEDIERERDKEQQQEQEVAAITQFWDNNGFGYNNINAKQSLLLWLDDSKFKNPVEMILKALDIASKNNKRTGAYVEGILKNWEKQSILTPEEADQQRKPEKNKSTFDFDPTRDSF